VEAGQSRMRLARFDKPHAAFAPCCCSRRHCSAARRRSRLALTLAEREDILRGIACDSPLVRWPDDCIERPSTLSREISRHGGRPAIAPMMRIVELGLGVATEEVSAGPERSAGHGCE